MIKTYNNAYSEEKLLLQEMSKPYAISQCKRVTLHKVKPGIPYEQPKDYDAYRESAGGIFLGFFLLCIGIFGVMMFFSGPRR